MLTPFATQPPSMRHKVANFLVSSITLKGGDSLPTCTFTAMVALAFLTCKIEVTFFGLLREHPPVWINEVQWEGGDGVPSSSILARLKNSPKTPSHNRLTSFGMSTFAGDEEEKASNKGADSLCMCVWNGTYYEGWENILHALEKRVDAKEWQRLVAESPHFELLMSWHGLLILAINDYVRNDENGNGERSKRKLLTVLAVVNEHLRMNGDGKDFLVHENELHLLDCLVAPLLQRCACLITFFENSPMEGKAIANYLDKICSTDAWKKVAGTDSISEANSAYIESIRSVLGKKLRQKTRRTNATICI